MKEFDIPNGLPDLDRINFEIARERERDLTKKRHLSFAPGCPPRRHYKRAALEGIMTLGKKLASQKTKKSTPF